MYRRHLSGQIDVEDFIYQMDMIIGDKDISKSELDFIREYIERQLIWLRREWILDVIHESNYV